MPSYKRRADLNQPEIVQALLQAGYHVTDLHHAAGGVADLLLSRNGVWYLVEVKNKAGRNRFTQRQNDWYRAIKAPVYAIRDVNDVASLIKGELLPINR